MAAEFIPKKADKVVVKRFVFLLLFLWVELSLAERIAIFTGTFDPPHVGHRAIPEQILAHNVADAVYVIPDDGTSFKPNKLSFEHRHQMVKLLFAGNPNIKFLTPEMKQKLSSGEMWNVLKVVKEAHPKSQFSLVMGGDVFEKYREFNSGFMDKNFSLIVMERDQQTRIPAKLKGQKVTRMILPGGNSSSTLSREALKAGKKPDNLTDPVFHYISQHQLYHFQAPGKAAPSGCLSRQLATLLSH